jgi:spore coat polysaccharide biosynthesis protein SpsF
MGSSRLPGKSLEPLGDSTVLDWVVDRSRRARSVAGVVVATSTRPEDDAIADHLSGSDVRVVRGSADDVLSRYLDVISALESEAKRSAASAPNLVVRITADCPFVDPGLIDLAVNTITEANAEYASTSLDGRYPRGLDVEAVRVAALQEAGASAVAEDEREHVTLHIYRNQDRFSCVPVVAPDWARRPDLRITLDEPDDLRLLQELTADGSITISAPGAEVVDYLSQRPELAAINRDVEHRNVTW